MCRRRGGGLMDVVVVLLLENLGANNKVRNAGIVVCLKKKSRLAFQKYVVKNRSASTRVNSCLSPFRSFLDGSLISSLDVQPRNIDNNR